MHLLMQYASYSRTDGCDSAFITTVNLLLSFLLPPNYSYANMSNKSQLIYIYIYIIRMYRLHLRAVNEPPTQIQL